MNQSSPTFLSHKLAIPSDILKLRLLPGSGKVTGKQHMLTVYDTFELVMPTEKLVFVLILSHLGGGDLHVDDDGG